ncbi:hypothetical protein BH18ACT4_BH18ACT4_14950 [soil metagenome]
MNKSQRRRELQIRLVAIVPILTLALTACHR